jgi:two-component system, LytTR family, response regulator
MTIATDDGRFAPCGSHRDTGPSQIAVRMLRILIVDDEPLARAHLRSLLEGDPGVIVAGECGDGAAAVAAISCDPPDLVLLDIQMPELDGFDVVRAVGVEQMPLVIFVTAHDAHALEAFAVHAVDYLLKPVAERRLLATVARAKRLAAVPVRSRAAEVAALAALITDVSASRPAPPTELPRFAIRGNGRVTLVPAADIDWVEAMDNYVRVHIGPTTHTIRDTLTHVVRRLPPHMFLRIHRSAAINVRRVRELRTLTGTQHVVILADGTRVAAGRRHRPAIRRLLRQSL